MSRLPVNFFDLTREQLRLLVARWNFPPVHAARLWSYVYLEGVECLDTMPELPARFRARVEGELRFVRPAVATEAHSTDGFTRKYLLALADGRQIETVLMRYTGRVSACLSTQAGCALGCVFCATGQMGFARNLTPGEIVGQAMHIDAVLRVGCGVPAEPGRTSAHAEESPYRVPPLANPASPSPHARHERLRNVVFMGMGEPLLNYDAAMTAVDILRDSGGLAIAAGRITLSTVGIVPGIVRLADERRSCHLAVSLHAATQEERAALVPAAKAWPLDELMAACRYYIGKLERRIFFEWTIIAGQNDRPEQAHAVGRLLQGLRAQVNLIPLNPTAGYAGAPAAQASARRFQEILSSYRLPSTVRQRRGLDIAAGCGQLATTKTAIP
jgi:23S rRNA (adenine2503-C2)-methyltransferase